MSRVLLSFAITIVLLLQIITFPCVILGEVSPPEYEIFSVSTDQFQYQNGDPVIVSILVQNNGGAGSDIQVFCKLYGSVDVCNFQMEAVAVPPGETIQILHEYTIPLVEYAQEYDADVWIEDDGVLVLSENFPDVFQSASLFPAQIQQGQAALYQCLPPEAECAGAVWDMIPLLAFQSDVNNLITRACYIQSKLESGEDVQAGAAGLIAWYSVFSVMLEFVPAAGSVESMIPSATLEAISCSSGLVASGSFGQADADYLAMEIYASQDSVGVGFRNLVVADGPVRLRVHQSDCFTDADTMGLKRAWVVEVDSTRYSWAYVGHDAVPVGQSNISNPTNEILTEMRAMAAGEVDVAVLHNEGYGAPFYLEFEPFFVTETTVCWLSIDDYSMDDGIRIDYDGDGVIDHVVFREGQVSGGIDGADFLSGVRLFDAYPNPFNPSTTFVYKGVEGKAVRLAIYDVAGRLVRVLVDERSSGAGRVEVRWNGTDLAGRMMGAGVYFCQLDTGKERVVKRVVLVK